MSRSISSECKIHMSKWAQPSLNLLQANMYIFLGRFCFVFEWEKCCSPIPFLFPISVYCFPFRYTCFLFSIQFPWFIYIWKLPTLIHNILANCEEKGDVILFWWQKKVSYQIIITFTREFLISCLLTMWPFLPYKSYRL